MWNSGQTAPPAPAWGWPPNQSYQYNAHNADPNQSWAAAAALWAQQRTLQEQYSKNGAPPPANYHKPPEPPGPPPVQPHGLPPLPPLPPSDAKDVVVHDYNHGQQEPTTSTVQTVDYQHGGTASESLPSLMENDVPPVADTDVYDYNHGQSETAANDTNWQQQNYNEIPPAPVAGGWQNTEYNQDWSQQQQWHANQWNNNDGNWNQQQWNQEENQGNDYYNNPHQGGYNDNRMNKKYSAFDSIGSAGSNSPDLAEIAKKSKSLPLWLRQGLEKMEKDKKKPTEKAKDDLPNAKLVSGYQHGSPTSSPDRNASDNEEVGDERTKKTSRKVRRRSISPDIKVKEVKQRSNESDNEEDDELDEEEKQKFLILKIKTWMTDILLGVTNDEVQTVCNEVYFEMKRSAKTKATQIRKSGGLEALRLASFGGEDESSSESEPEPEPKPKPMFFERQRQITSAKEDVKKFSKIIEPVIPKFVKPKASEIIDKSKFDSVDSKRKFTEDAHVLQRENEQLEKREQKQDVETVKHSSRKSSSSNDDESDVESKSVSSDSEDHKRRKKSKRKRSRTRSRTPKKSRKKSSKSSRRRSTSTSDEESERRSSRKKKHKRKHYSSEDEEYSDSSSSSYRKKSSKGKKHKHRARSDSRSPSRRHSKKKR